MLKETDRLLAKAVVVVSARQAARRNIMVRMYWMGRRKDRHQSRAESLSSLSEASWRSTSKGVTTRPRCEPTRVNKEDSRMKLRMKGREVRYLCHDVINMDLCMLDDQLYRPFECKSVRMTFNVISLLKVQPKPG